MEKINNLQDIFKILHQQQQIMQNLSRISTLSPVWEMRQTVSDSLRLYRENSPVGRMTRSFKTFDRNIFKGIPTISDPIAPMRKCLSAINRPNKPWQEQLATVATSWQLLNTSLQNAMPRMDIQQHTAFANFNTALCGISATFLKNIYSTQTWQEAAIVGTTNSIITETLNDVYAGENTFAEDSALDRFKEAILTELAKLLHRTTHQRAKEYLLELISVISVLLSIYSVCTTPGKRDIAEIVRKELRSALETHKQEIDTLVDRQLAKIRSARLDAPLKYAPKKKARILGIVKQGQQMTVVETRHKYLLVSYIDMETLEPRSGFVLKKYFPMTKPKTGSGQGH